MNFEVPDSVKQKAKQCPNDFSCIATGYCGDQGICKVDHSVGESVLCLTSNERGACSCPYRLSFGYGQICMCPVRYYLYSKYPQKFG